jgi:2-oxo-3-hexenedioate decarboxylase
VAHAFEIVQSHFPGWIFQAADTIVDSALHGALLIGEPQQIDGGPDHLIDAMESLEIDLYCDGAFRETGRGSDVLGSPLHAIAQLILVLADDPHAVGLQAGELVTTGTVTTAHSIQRGQTWRSEVRGIELPGLSVQIQA